MPSRVIVGCQWGDEGKGKIVDLLSCDADMIVRFQGGANAGHTVIKENRKFVLHLLPTGILRAEKQCVIAAGVVVDPSQLIDEIAFFENEGISVRGRLFISGKAHLVMPYHKYLDRYLEGLRRANSIGTTGRGIGPAYTDRAARSGIRLYDILNQDHLAELLASVLEVKKASIPNLEHLQEFDFHYNLDLLCTFREKIKGFIFDTAQLISEAYSAGKAILFEGAQGTLLDVDNGTYPYTTSSSTIAGGLFVGCGLAPFAPDEIIGVVKAYSTRVGEGPFPTELKGDEGETLRKRGAEFGATTGRPRRCGWLDLVALKYAVKLNGVNLLAITKLDVLQDYDPLKLCIGYKYRNQILEDFPDNTSFLKDCQPIYAEMPGWKCSIDGIREYNKLPEKARAYLNRIEQHLGASAKYISVGSAREQTIKIS
ncbi:MAG: adenylosuccinate synthase [candidate division Zixibacteria bacterium CG_4_9_14_3_um_filter_46_8]|nr:MAG: adenylosuccinate synthase [candidate division Zixibacteria bacterium CG_4_9_14_3_um_filter_46_8]